MFNTVNKKLKLLYQNTNEVFEATLEEFKYSWLINKILRCGTVCIKPYPLDAEELEDVYKVFISGINKKGKVFEETESFTLVCKDRFRQMQEDNQNPYRSDELQVLSNNRITKHELKNIVKKWANEYFFHPYDEMPYFYFDNDFQEKDLQVKNYKLFTK